METADVSKPESSEDTCVICLESVTERAITVPCNHYTFDFICLVSWLQERSTCPLCKIQITAVQYDWHSPPDFKSYAVRRTHEPRDAPPNFTTRSSLGYAPYGLPRRPQRHFRPYEPPQPDLAVLRRRHVYRQKLFSLHVGSNPLSRYRDVTPEMIAQSPDLQSKAKLWIRRELRVFAFLYTDPEGTPSAGATTSSNAEFLLSYVVAVLKKVDLKASNGHAEHLLQEYLGREKARLFLHELTAWMRSPYLRLGEWDREVQYEEELPEAFDGQGMGLLAEKPQRRCTRSVYSEHTRRE